MRTWPSSIRVLIAALALYLAIVLVLGTLALAMRAAAAAPKPPVAPTAALASAAPEAPAAILVRTSGTLVARGDGLLAVQELGGDEPVAFTVGTGTAITRDGKGATLVDLRRGDQVQLLIDGRTGQALDVRAAPAPAPSPLVRDSHGLLAALALIATAAVLFARRRVELWPTAGRAIVRRPLVVGVSRNLTSPGRGALSSGRRWSGPQHA